MSDLIDRQALMESVGVADDCEKCQYNDTIHKGFCTMPSEFVNVCEAIADAPSVEPKKGRWIFARYFVWECSECGKNPTKGMGYTQSRRELFRYCPNCGTEMKVTEPYEGGDAE